MADLEKELSLDELQALEQKVEEMVRIVIEEENKNYRVETIIYPKRTVGVQGDQRSYAYTAEIALYNGEDLTYDLELLSKLSTRIPNRIKDINKVVVLIQTKE